MISLDSEATGLWPQADTEAFAFGYYTGEEEYTEYVRDIDPYTRKPTEPWDKKTKNDLRDRVETEDAVIMQNANYDTRMLCKSEIIDWREPCNPDWWRNIVELQDFMHLHHSPDADFKGSLKKLSAMYLDGSVYESEDELDRIVQRCRTFARTRLDGWKTARQETIPQAKSSSSRDATKWHKMDMWLPRAIRKHVPEHDLIDYFDEDFCVLKTVMSDYLREDCVNTLELFKGFFSTLSERHGDDLQSLLQMNREIAPVIWSMEVDGVSVNTSAIDDAINCCEEWIEKTQRICFRLGKIDSFKPKVLRKALFETFDLKPVLYTEEKREPSTSAKAIPKLKEQCEERGLKKANTFLSNLLAHGKYLKKKQYLEGYKRVTSTSASVPYELETSDDRVFTSLKATGTGTTRFVCYDPPLQTIEKGSNPYEDDFPDVAALLDKSPKLRAMFTPPKDYWWFPIDYSQLQLRVFAAATGDPTLIQSFEDGYDFHTFMAMAIFDIPPGQEPTSSQRRIAKNVNFGFIFGSSEKKIDQTAGKPGLMKYVLKMFPGAHEFIKETKESIAQDGVVYTLGGYPLHIPLSPNPWNGELSYAAHRGVNYIVQGTEGEIVKKAMYLTHNYLTKNYPEARLVLQIHDEIIFQTPAKPPKKHLRNICRLMETAGRYSNVKTPVDVELCRNNLATKTKVVL
jgi:DNA polymerase I-like protein with 3'-5' exonuclease and polymerase domains